MKKDLLRKILALVMAMAMLLVMAGCSSSSGNGTSDVSEPSDAADAPEASDAAEAGDAAGAEGEGADAEDAAAEITNVVPERSVAYANSAAVRHESITVCANGDPGNLLPLDTQTTGKEILDSIFEKLYIIDGFGGELLPNVAAELPVASGNDDEGLFTYDIAIRDNIYDTDGNHVTAADVAFSYNYLVTNSTPQNMGKYHSAEAVEDYVVRFHCDELNGVSDFGNLFAQQWIFTEAAESAHDFATDPVGTGPYQVASFTEGSSVVLEANDNYWAEGQEYQLARHCTNVQTIHYVFMSEASQHANALRTGEIDYSNSVSETDLPEFLNDGAYASEYVVYPYLENLTFYLLPNCDANSPCSDINLRKAIMYAVDGYTCAVASGNSSAEVVYDLYNSKFPETRESWSTTEDTYYTNPSIETAMEYLEQSGYSGETLVLACSDAPPFQQNVATVVATVLQGIGINVELNVLSGSIFNSTIADPTAFDLVINMMAADDYGVVDVARLMSADSYGGGQETMNFIVDEELQRLITLCNTAEGHTDENTQALHDYIIENAYGRGLFATTTYNVITNDVTELAMSFKFLPLPGGCVYADNEF